MGIFSSKKIITVSSTLYNMAGDEDDRPDFLKGTLFGAVMANAPSLADDITGAYFNGPGQKQLQFFRYSQQVNLSTLPSTTIVNSVALDTVVVGAQIPPTTVPPAPAGLTLTCYSAEANEGDFEPWIERWILLNHPTRIGEEWLGEYEPATNTFSVEFPNNDFFSWLNTDAPVFSSSKRFIAAKYIESAAASESAVVVGTPTTGVAVLPDVTGWTQDSDTATFTNTLLTRNRTTIVTYNNGDPSVTTEDAVNADVTEPLNTAVEEYSREIVISKNGIEMQGERQFWTFTGTDTVGPGFTAVQVTTADLGGGVIQTTTSTTTGEQIIPTWTTRYDDQDLFVGSQYGPEQIYLYEIGTGNAVLDALVGTADASGFQEFFPFMPVRINNVSVLEPQYETLLDEMTPAYRRAFPGKRFSELIETVEDNPSIDDIDYAYVCFGASLNAKDMTARQYIYRFMDKMIPFQSAGSGNVMTQLQADVTAYQAALADLDQWESDVAAAASGSFWSAILPRPTIPGITPPAINTIRINDPVTGLDYRMSWVHIENTQFNGTFEVLPDIQSKIKDSKLEVGPSFSWDVRETYNTRDGEETRYNTNTIPSCYIYYQVDENTYRRIQVWGLVSENYIYGGKSVKITSTEGIEDTDESGFLVPLHYPTMNEMNIVDYTQFCTSNVHILFNSYEITKQKWYQRGIFKILLVIAIIIIAVVVFPGAFAGGAGVLGGNLAVGTAIGLTGTAALVAGVVANYIASIIVAELLKIVGTALFGEKWGALFAAIAGFALGAAISGTSLFSAEGLLGLGNAIANGYAGWVQGDIAEMSEDLEVDNESYEERMEYIQNLIDGLDGNNDLNFDPRFLTGNRRGNGQSGSYVMETAEQYIQRTTMTGSDVVDLTHSMVFDYVEIARTLPRNAQ